MKRPPGAGPENSAFWLMALAYGLMSAYIYYLLKSR